MMIDLINSQADFQNIRTLMSEGKNAELGNAAQACIPPEPVKSLPANAASTSPTAASSMMSHNFVHAGDDKSKYQEAREKENAVLSQQTNRQNAILATAMAEMNALSERDQQNYAIRSYIGRKAARRMLEEKEASTLEASERNLKETKEDIARKTKEALENGGQNALVGEGGALPPVENDVALSPDVTIDAGSGATSAKAAPSIDMVV